MKNTTILIVLVFLIVLQSADAWAGPYAPAAGEPGSTAVAVDSGDFLAWAVDWTDYQPGLSVDEQWQTPERALGPGGGAANDVVSLGRGGRITMIFDPPIKNGLGWDFAVFENSPNNTFLELAYVEVSSDGLNFIRFANDSATVQPVDGYGAVDPTNITGLAGKYRLGYGTPFDLQELATRTEVLNGTVNLGSVSHVRILDIVGDGTFLDSSGDPIYDPYPTHVSAGFDLNGIGVRHQASGGVAPDQPVLVSPQDLSIGVALSMSLNTGAFADDDIENGDFHYGSRWQIGLDANFSTPVLDVTSPLYLTTLPLFRNLLEPLTIYYWRVQHLDSENTASAWSETFSFTTGVDDADNDLNGIPDDQEIDDPGLDLNGDAVPDINQIGDSYKVVSTPDSQAIALETDPLEAEIDTLEWIDPEDSPEIEGQDNPAAFFLGLVRFRLLTATPGATVTLTIHLSEQAPDGYNWLKFDPARGWYTYSTPADFSADRTSVTLTFEDGGQGDADGLVNGVIVDPGGIGTFEAPEEPIVAPSSGDAGLGSAGGCFIRVLVD